MKTYKLFLAIILSVFFTGVSSAQSSSSAPGHQKSESFKVWGKCEMCKARIENTVKTAGVTAANWVIKTHMLTVTYDPSKTSTDLLSKKLALAGHDTERYKASDADYEKLPSCCHYDRAK
jgi:cation transport ATPase